MIKAFVFMLIIDKILEESPIFMNIHKIHVKNEKLINI